MRNTSDKIFLTTVIVLVFGGIFILISASMVFWQEAVPDFWAHFLTSLFLA